MIRQWQPTDIPLVTLAMLDLKKKTIFEDSGYDTDPQEGVKWLHNVYLDHMKTVYIYEDEDGQVQGICAVGLEENMFPPHVRVLSEWCMWGDSPKVMAQLWKQAKWWGKTHGALFAKRATSVEHNREVVKWEKLT